MSNHYTKFAFIVPLSDEQADEAVALLALITDEAPPDTSKLPGPFKDLANDLTTAGEDLEALTIKASAGGLFLGSDGEGSTSTVCAVVQAVLDHFDLDLKIAFEAACYTDRLLVDGFGGTAIVVSRESVLSKTTADACQELLDSLA